MEELFKAIDIAPIWAVYATLGTAAFKSAVALIGATETVGKSTKAKQGLSALSLLSSYLLALSAFGLFIALN